MTYFLLISGASLAVLAFLLWRAPRGWQDDNGFHLGQEPYRRIDTSAAGPQQAAAETPRARVRKAA